MIYVIDTHALVWFPEGSQNLSHKTTEIMLTSESPIIVPTIVLAEMKYLFDRKRIATAFNDIRKRLYDDERVTIYPLDDLVIDYLPEQLEIHDAIICATCLALQNTLGEEVRLITKDEAIIKSSIVATVWSSLEEMAKNSLLLMIPLKIIEVQNGKYLEEDDIVRVEDDYARS